ncbi:uncharacterized protein LOC105185637 [Harpegnathos saltator]|uniref:uncharacterized protein LOC105185637 n=1 Tax=Harpegnathos saltator TaxID=610380 RepID=UPI000DBED4C1|nr:uncharacterized protein LOC105185637 [Harpegnathos saltator]
MGEDNLINDICMNLQTKGDTTKDEIFLLPGIEGCGNIFYSLAPKIEAPATCLQYGTYNIDKNCNTVADIVDSIFKHMIQRIKSKQDFLIIAYSYGTLIAIELTRRLENMHFQGRLVFIDGAPEQLRALLNQIIFGATTEELENNILLSIMDILEPTISGKLFLELNKLINWDDKLNMFVKLLPPLYMKFSAESMKSLCLTIYKHVQALYKYNITELPKITSPVILLKPTTMSLNFPHEDYGLHKITTGNVQVHYIEGNHFSILYNDKVVATINGQYIDVIYWYINNGKQ